MLKKLAPIILFSLILFAPPVLNGRALSDAALLSAPLQEGGVREQDFFEALLRRCRETGLPHGKYNSNPREDTPPFPPVASVPRRGEKPAGGPASSPRELVVVIPVSDLENNALWSPFLGLQLIENLRRAPPAAPITLLFAGAETNRPDQEPLGSRLFLENYYPADPAAVLTLRLSGRPRDIRTITGSRGHTAPAWWLQAVRRALTNQGFSVTTPHRPHLVYRLGLSRDTPGLRPWQERGFPALMLTGEQAAPPPGALREIPDSVKTWTAQWAGTLRELSALSFQNRPRDTHYLLLPEAFPGSPIVPENLLVKILMSSMAVLLLILFSLPHYIRRNLRFLLKKVWTLPIFFAMAFLFLLTATGLIQALLNLQETLGLWKELPLLFFLLKLSAAILLFSVTYPLFRRFPHSRSSHFYGFSAAMTAAINSLVILFFELSFSLALFWAIIAVTLFSIIRRRPAKILLFLLSPLGLILLGYIVFSLGDLTLSRLIILSPLRGNALLTLLLLPFLLLQSSLHFSRPHKPGQSRRKAHLRSLFISAGWGLTALGLSLYLITYSPYSRQNQPLRVLDQMDGHHQERRITVESPAPLPALTLRTATEEYPLSGGSYSESVYPSRIPRLLTLRADSRRFLDRQQVDVKLTQWGTPSRLELTLHSEEPLVLYESPFPYTVSLDQSRATFHIGRFPPNPLEFSFTMASPGRMTLETQAVYRELPYPLSLARGNGPYLPVSAPDGTAVSGETVYRREIELQGLPVKDSGPAALSGPEETSP